MTTETTIFTIRTRPDLDDPHNWTWTVSWKERQPSRADTPDDRPRGHFIGYTHSGPKPGDTVLSSPRDARFEAERYARAMAEGLARADDYRHIPVLPILG